MFFPTDASFKTLTHPRTTTPCTPTEFKGNQSFSVAAASGVVREAAAGADGRRSMAFKWVFKSHSWCSWSCENVSQERGPVVLVRGGLRPGQRKEAIQWRGRKTHSDVPSFVRPSHTAGTGDRTGCSFLCKFRPQSSKILQLKQGNLIVFATKIASLVHNFNFYVLA